MHETETKSRLPIDARVVAITETHHYDLPPEHARYIENIRGVYLYNANRRTYCCEMTPSFWLIFLCHSILLSKEGKAIDDEVCEKLYEEYEIDNPGNNQYVHCAVIEQLTKTTSNYLEYGATGESYEDSDYNEQIEGLVEHFQGNTPF